jgi:voltage-gated potassium channel
MVEHRKGLNRALFWLYAGVGKWPTVFRWAMLAFDLLTIVLFVVHPLLTWRDGVDRPIGVWLFVDITVVSIIVLDFAARLYIERDKIRFFLNPVNIVDLIVVATLVVPLFANLLFLRILRAVRIVRAFEFLDRNQTISRWLHVNSNVVAKVVNLLVFMFITASIVYVTQVQQNPQIANYLDALYFSIGALTTTGFGDITLVGIDGRWLSVVIMVLGVTMFLQLIRAIAIGDKEKEPCPACGLDYHDRDAAHCKRCGASLFPEAPDAAKPNAKKIAPPRRR